MYTHTSRCASRHHGRRSVLGQLHIFSTSQYGIANGCAFSPPHTDRIIRPSECFGFWTPSVSVKPKPTRTHKGAGPNKYTVA